MAFLRRLRGFLYAHFYVLPPRQEESYGSSGFYTPEGGKAHEEAALVLRQVSMISDLRETRNFKSKRRSKMIVFYERACKEAGLSEEEIAKIRRVFDSEAKRNKRDREAKEKEGIVITHLEAYRDSEGEEIALPVYQESVEETILKEMELQALRECLSELPEDDRKFLFAIFSGERGALAKIEKETGIPHNSLIYRKEKLLKTLRKKMSKKF